MKKISGIFLGSAAARRISFGFVPDYVTIRNVALNTTPTLEWDRAFTVAALYPEGIITVRNNDTQNVSSTVLTRGNGIQRYYGGDVIAASTAADLIPVSQHRDFAGDMRGKGANGNIRRFVLDHAGNATGHFDNPADTTFVNVGSRIWIGDYAHQEMYSIVAIANAGTAANEVTLDRAAPANAEVRYISYRYDFAPAPVGLVMPEGIRLAAGANAVNADGNLCVIEAGLYGS